MDKPAEPTIFVEAGKGLMTLKHVTFVPSTLQNTLMLVSRMIHELISIESFATKLVQLKLYLKCL